MTFWLDNSIVKSRENTNKSENDGSKHITNDISLAMDGVVQPRPPYVIEKVVVNDPMRPVDQTGRVVQLPPIEPKAEALRHKQADRFLKKLSAYEKRKQITMRKQIAEEIDNA